MNWHTFVAGTCFLSIILSTIQPSSATYVTFPCHELRNSTFALWKQKFQQEAVNTDIASEWARNHDLEYWKFTNNTKKPSSLAGVSSTCASLSYVTRLELPHIIDAVIPYSTLKIGINKDVCSLRTRDEVYEHIIVSDILFIGRVQITTHIFPVPGEDDSVGVRFDLQYETPWTLKPFQSLLRTHVERSATDAARISVKNICAALS